ncbi:MAG: hypothetical protein NTZ61_15035 [Proteobacteria bacterium]|nr:hypothetical protein [Pseudomonadota bacterium]
MRFEVAAAWGMGVALPLLDVLRRKTNVHPIASYVDDLIAGALLLVAARGRRVRAIRALRRVREGRPLCGVDCSARLCVAAAECKWRATHVLIVYCASASPKPSARSMSRLFLGQLCAADGQRSAQSTGSRAESSTVRLD